MRIVAFSDWRTQRFKELFNFLEQLDPPCDLILYGGDDTERFIEFQDPLIIQLFRGYNYRTLARRKASYKDFLDFINTMTLQIEDFFDQIASPSISDLKTIATECKRHHIKRFVYSVEGNDITESVVDDISKDTSNLSLSVSVPSLYALIDTYVDEDVYNYEVTGWLSYSQRSRIKIHLTPKEPESPYPLPTFSLLFALEDGFWSSRYSLDRIGVPKLLLQHPLPKKRIEIRSMYLWFIQKLHPLTTEQQIAFLKDNFHITNRSISLKPNKLMEWATANHLEHLASYARYGLLAITGNDCLHSYNVLIQGEKVTNLGKKTISVGGFTIIGIDGSESIVEDPTDRQLSTSGEVPLLDIGRNIGRPSVIREIFTKAKEDDSRQSPKIVLSHSPPFQALDLSRRHNLAYIGSKVLRNEIIADPSIRLVICGHVHLMGGRNTTLNNAVVVNCSSHDSEGAPGNVADITLDDSGNILSLNWRHIGMSLGYIRGVGPKIAKKLAFLGIHNPSQLLSADISELLARSRDLKIKGMGRKRLTNYQNSVRSLLKKEIIYLPSPPLSLSMEDGMIIDIETDLSQSSIWLVGVWDRDQYHSFYQSRSQSFTSEKKMLKHFTKFLDASYKDNPSLVLFCYSGTNFDFRVLEGRLSELDVRSEVFSKVPRYDLMVEVQRRVILPLPSLKLKDINVFLGYSRESPSGYDGLMASADYYSKANDNDEFMERLIQYNKEDCESVLYCWKRIFQNEE